MRFILTEAMTVSKVFLDEETGKFYRIKGDMFVEIPAPGGNFDPTEDDDDDEYNPDVDYEKQNKQAKKEPIEIDEFSFNDDEEEDEDEEDEDDEIGDDEEEDETKHKGVIVHDRITGKDFVWNKRKQQYVPFR